MEPLGDAYRYQLTTAPDQGSSVSLTSEVARCHFCRGSSAAAAEPRSISRRVSVRARARTSGDVITTGADREAVAASYGFWVAGFCVAAGGVIPARTGFLIGLIVRRYAKMARKSSSVMFW